MIRVHLTDALRGTLSECPFPVRPIIPKRGHEGQVGVDLTSSIGAGPTAVHMGMFDVKGQV